MTTPSFFGYMLSPKLALDQIWEVIETHEALVEEISFTFSFPAIDFNDVSMLVVTMDANPTGFAIPQLRINNNSSSNYFIDGRDIVSGSLVVIDKNIQNEIQLGRNNNNSYSGIVKIFLEKASTGTNFPMTISEFGNVGVPTNSQYVGRLNVDTPNITDIEIRQNTPSWKIGTRITLYKVLR